ncbi:E3 ubiquitin-protein ligase RNF146-like [Maniola hyperantus]|uniref:E3 ubiquitin-protein ligase RNF146-like n=1 Tax=Aphantopus hyperantus TaxID=2795564 RepID=UPI0021429631
MQDMERDEQEQDCAICLQKYHHPTQLPCGHVFCFLCVKGIAILSKKCAICRTHIPADYFDHPVLLDNFNTDETLETENEKYHWYYEGRNGWWKYDERSNIDLESAYNSNETECLLLLAGTLYCVDFENKVQFRRSDPTKRRRIKRDLPTLPSKGIAGIKIIDTRQTEDLESTTDVNTINIENEERGNDVILVTNVSVSSTSEDVNQAVHTMDDLADRLSNITIQREDQSRSDEEIVLEDNAENII